MSIGTMDIVVQVSAGYLENALLAALEPYGCIATHAGGPNLPLAFRPVSVAALNRASGDVEIRVGVLITSFEATRVPAGVELGSVEEGDHIGIIFRLDLTVEDPARAVVVTPVLDRIDASSASLASYIAQALGSFSFSIRLNLAPMLGSSVRIDSAYAVSVRAGVPLDGTLTIGLKLLGIPGTADPVAFRNISLDMIYTDHWGMEIGVEVLDRLLSVAVEEQVQDVVRQYLAGAVHASLWKFGLHLEPGGVFRFDGKLAGAVVGLLDIALCFSGDGAVRLRTDGGGATLDLRATLRHVWSCEGDSFLVPDIDWEGSPSRTRSIGLASLVSTDLGTLSPSSLMTHASGARLRGFGSITSTQAPTISTEPVESVSMSRRCSGAITSTRTVTVRNSSIVGAPARTLHVCDVLKEGDLAAFELDPEPVAFSLEDGESQSFQVRYVGDASSSSSMTLVFLNNDERKTLSVSAPFLPGELVVGPNPCRMEGTRGGCPGVQTPVFSSGPFLANHGEGTLTVCGMEITGPDAAAFELDANAVLNRPIGPGETREFDRYSPWLRFEPGQREAQNGRTFEATLSVRSTAGEASIALVGTIAGTRCIQLDDLFVLDIDELLAVDDVFSFAELWLGQTGPDVPDPGPEDLHLDATDRRLRSHGPDAGLAGTFVVELFDPRTNVVVASNESRFGHKVLLPQLVPADSKRALRVRRGPQSIKTSKRWTLHARVFELETIATHTARERVVGVHVRRGLLAVAGISGVELVALEETDRPRSLQWVEGATAVTMGARNSIHLAEGGTIHEVGADSGSPLQRASVAHIGRIDALAAAGERLVAAGSHLCFLDDPRGARRAVVTRTPLPERALELWTFGGLALVRTTGALLRFDLGERIRASGVLELEDAVGRVTAWGPYAYVELSSGDTLIIDVTAPGGPRRVGRYEGRHWSLDMKLQANLYGARLRPDGRTIDVVRVRPR